MSLKPEKDSKPHPLEPAPLAPEQDAALLVLIAGGSTSKAAESAGVAVRTVQRWLLEPAFSAALAEYRVIARRVALQRLGAAIDDATDALTSILRDDKAPAMARVHAARFVIESALSWASVHDLADQVNSVYQKQYGNGNRAIDFAPAPQDRHDRTAGAVEEIEPDENAATDS